MENFRRKWNLDRITVTKIMKCIRKNWCSKRRKTFKIEKFVVLEEYFEQQTDCNRYRRKISKSRKSASWRGISRICISLSNKWKPCHGAINSQPRNLDGSQFFGAAKSPKFKHLETHLFKKISAHHFGDLILAQTS